MKKTRFFLWLRFILGCAGWLVLLEKSFEQQILDVPKYSEQRWENIHVVEAAKTVKAPETAEATETVEEVSETAKATKTVEEVPEAVELSVSSKIMETPEPSNSGNIRVVLMDDAYSSYYHSAVLLEVDGKQYAFSEETEDTVQSFSPNQGGIRVLSLLRNDEHPVYEGTMEVRKEKEGFLLINELPIENYLKAVVPSEMPAVYEMEALKAQAVCARTYALKQMEEKRMRVYYADVDDSAACQVYRREAPEEKTSEAVEETSGQVLKCEDQLIEAYYFSTSAGMTSTDEVWGADEGAEYLKSVSCSFDAAFPWRNWSVSIPWENLENFLSETYGTHEKLLDVRIQKKNQSGAVTELVLITASDSFKQEGEYAVREALSPNGCRIARKDGKETDGGALLPSAYITLHAKQGESVEIEGSGYGHGVGMSQTAANEMAKEGYLFDEILGYFYQNIEIDTM